MYFYINKDKLKIITDINNLLDETVVLVVVWVEHSGSVTFNDKASLVPNVLVAEILKVYMEPSFKSVTI